MYLCKWFSHYQAANLSTLRLQAQLDGSCVKQTPHTTYCSPIMTACQSNIKRWSRPFIWTTGYQGNNTHTHTHDNSPFYSPLSLSQLGSPSLVLIMWLAARLVSEEPLIRKDGQTWRDGAQWSSISYCSGSTRGWWAAFSGNVTWLLIESNSLTFTAAQLESSELSLKHVWVK